MTTRDDGGASERIAPVIPLFGTAHGASGRARDGSDPTADHVEAPDRSDRPPAPGASGDRGDANPLRGEESAQWRSTWDDGPHRAARPIAPTESDSRFGSTRAEEQTGPSDRHPARGHHRSAPRLRALQNDSDRDHDRETTAPDVREIAEELLVRKLRTRSLSVSEARLILRGVGHDGITLDAGAVDDILDTFTRRGYLDDAQLAGQLVAAGIERKGQGRVALSRSLSQRGIPREVIDAALDELPDDDAERALEYARSKARSLTRLDADTALRRLVGQLARRGYTGGVAMSAAKTALAEATFGRPTSGVRFVDSD